jgi:hypothetical protein
MTKIYRLSFGGLFFFLIGISAFGETTLPSADYAITADQLRFTYQGYDNGLYFHCQPTIENEIGHDWRVQCADETKKLTKSFLVHLWVTRYDHAQAPRVTYELLYWVKGQGSSSGSSTWFHLKDYSALEALTVGQSVDGDTAGLYLDLSLNKRKR